MMVRDCCLRAALQDVREDFRALYACLWGRPPDAESVEQARIALNPLGEHIAQAAGMAQAFADMHEGRSWARQDLPKGSLWCDKCRAESGVQVPRTEDDGHSASSPGPSPVALGRGR